MFDCCHVGSLPNLHAASTELVALLCPSGLTPLYPLAKVVRHGDSDRTRADGCTIKLASSPSVGGILNEYDAKVTTPFLQGKNLAESLNLGYRWVESVVDSPFLGSELRGKEDRECTPSSGQKIS